MASFNRILLCYDATREGRRALREGADLARECRAQTHLLAVLDQAPLQWATDIASAVPFEAAEEAAREILRDGVACLQEKGLAATGHFVVGRPIDVIANYCADLRADLIVLAHHRRGPFKRWWDGRDDRLLLDRVSCSVLVVTAPDPAEPQAAAA
ncbi:universal stress protein [Paraburkholderia lycopersici]|uniref:Nucleotide-binding universal stress protein, UspA family n=1 Tax=Paraburkholderia lycopersici TaxID=416944 RepID=A0A1G6JAT4_9BURK|nr:universal stress protein [Paraburkholderia lycopersici]SDC15851.1 Nucleotide-binding universal stress protein, UspA family [Paraburkholderia lycopersici]